MRGDANNRGSEYESALSGTKEEGGRSWLDEFVSDAQRDTIYV